MIWSERLDDLRALAAHPDKLSSAEIGRRMGCTRNAIISACHRNGIAMPIKASVKKHRAKVRHPNNFAGRNLRRKLESKTIEPEEFEIQVADVVPLNIPLDELPNNGCHYPYGDGPFLFCGHPVRDGSSYCPAHHRLCYHRADPDKRQRNNNIWRTA